MGDFPDHLTRADSSWRGGSPGFSGEIARGLFGGGASGVGPAVEDRQPGRRLLSLAAVRDGMDRGSAAKIGGMDRQTLRDWVHRFNAAEQGLVGKWTAGSTNLLVEQRSPGCAEIVARPRIMKKDKDKCRRRHLDLKHVIAGVRRRHLHPRCSAGKLLKNSDALHRPAGPVIDSWTSGPSSTKPALKARCRRPAGRRRSKLVGKAMP